MKGSNLNVGHFIDQFEDHGRVISCLKQIRDMDDLDVIRSLRNSVNVEKEYKGILSAQVK